MMFPGYQGSLHLAPSPFWGREITIEEILRRREDRAAAQQKLLSRTGCLISFSLNVPGRYKRFFLADRAFHEGRQGILEAVVSGGQLRQEVLFDLPTGLESMMVLEAEPEVIKQRSLLLEQTSPIGRYYDIDILTASEGKLSRHALGYPPRRCLLCNQDAFLCRRKEMHPEAALREKMLSDLQQYFLSQDADEIAELAQRALLAEAAVSPKPGLVDRFHAGAHSDMDFFTFLDSASALRPWFRAFAQAGLESPDVSPECLFPLLRTIGLQAEAAMFRATSDVNTHKGCIFSFGILCAAMGQIPRTQWTVSTLTDRAAQIAANALPDFSDPSLLNSHGGRVYTLHGTNGIRGEASQGFPAIRNVGLPTLESALGHGLSLNDAAAWTLLHLISQLEDTNVLFRGGPAAAATAREMAEAAIVKIQDKIPLSRVLLELDRSFTDQNLSPGGCADLLALTLFLHFALS